MKKHSSQYQHLVAHALRVGTAGLLTAIGLGTVATGCLDRPVSPASPNTTNIFVDRIAAPVVDKIDLLFMIDNSISMADKQQILRAAVPQLLNRLIDPVCVVPETDPPDVRANSSAEGCPEGSEPEFRAVRDIHIGVITSSLGGSGGTLCSPDHGDRYWNETQNDHGHLITRPGPDSEAPPATWNDVGFLSWDPEGSARNPADSGAGESDPGVLQANFENLVTGAGERGCGYEASLEAWYRFLVDPDPPEEVVYDPGPPAATVARGLDTVLLDQRAQFLRPDSLVAIIMLSDENDCSVIDHGIGYLVGNPEDGAMPRATSQCDTDPNHPCCLSCIQANWPSDCADPRTDFNCQAGLFHGDVDTTQDRLNLRCHDQKRRFGLDLLHPTSRYVRALTSHELTTRAGEPAANPLFSENEQYYPDLVPRMDSGLIFLAGIVGVPWQDIATEDSLADPNTIRFLTSDEITRAGIWDQILGRSDTSPPIPPNDPFMVESVAPRAGTNPRTGIEVSPPSSTTAGNAINGHEYTALNHDDLQYACIFPLATPRDCAEAQDGQGCDCRPNRASENRPLCDGTIQTHAKAYPGTRFLEVLRDYGSNSIVASICPKNPNCDAAQAADPDCGYNPAVAAIIDALKVKLSGTCLPRQLATDSNGLVLCQVVEVTRQPSPAPCSDGLPGRSAVEPKVRDAVLDKMRDLKMCGGEDVPCDHFSLCQLTPAAENVDEPAYQECLNAPEADIRTAAGYCYIDGMTDRNQDGAVNCTSECYSSGAEDCDCVGNPELIAECDPSQRRLLRFVSPPNSEQPLPWPNSTVFVACQGMPFRTD